MKKPTIILAVLVFLCLTLTSALAAPLYVRPFSVVTEELDNGDFTLTTCGMKLTFTPIDVRFCLTRESSRYMFNNMGYYRDEIVPLMEDYNIYAMLYDRNHRTRVQVHIEEDGKGACYSAEEDWRLAAMERVNSINNGWRVEENEIVALEGLKLVRMLVVAQDADGSEEWRLIYVTHENGMAMEIQLTASGRKIIDQVETQVDAFVRNIRVEKLQDDAGQLS